MSHNNIYADKFHHKERTEGKAKRGCKFYRSDSLMSGCTALKMLYCKSEDKKCNFYKPKEKDG